MKGQVIIAVMGLCMAVSPAIAQNHCSEVLSQGVWNSFDTSESAASRQDVANWACSNSTSAGGGGFSYGGIGVNLSEQSARAACSGSSSNSQASADFHLTMRTVAASIVSAWQNCWNSFGSSASIGFLPSNVDFRLLLHAKGNTSNIDVAHAEVSKGVKCFSSIQTKGLLFSNDSSVSCSRQSPSTKVQIDIWFNSGAPRQALYIPPIPPIPPAPLLSCAEFQARNAETAACNRYTAAGYYWLVAGKISNYGTGMPIAQNPTEVPCDKDNLDKPAMTWRWPQPPSTWQTVRGLYVAANYGSGGDPECQLVGNPAVKWTDVPQGYHCGVFSVICSKQ
jgi:hypothetical protein